MVFLREPTNCMNCGRELLPDRYYVDSPVESRTGGWVRVSEDRWVGLCRFCYDSGRFEGLTEFEVAGLHLVFNSVSECDKLEDVAQKLRILEELYRKYPWPEIALQLAVARKKRT